MLLPRRVSGKFSCPQRIFNINGERKGKRDGFKRKKINFDANALLFSKGRKIMNVKVAIFCCELRVNLAGKHE